MAASSPTPVQTAEPVAKPRALERRVTGQATSDGAGVRLTRVLTQNLQRRLDPYLMLDAFGSDDPDDYIAGFPNHPHRGFETITYMVAGRMRHNDSNGNEGLLQNGGVQYMTAGRGIIHSELPEQEEGVMEGFQLWLNLPAAEKMKAPGYVDLQTDDIPEIQTPDGVVARIIAGTSHSVAGRIQHHVTQPLYLDLHFDGPSQFSQSLPATANAFIYVYRGEINLADEVVSAGQMGILANNADTDGVVLQANAPARVLLIAGQPIGEPIAQYGPFVMNSQQEIIQAVTDFQAGLFGNPR